MNKILCLAFLVGFAYSRGTGNDFLEEYPHGVRWANMSDNEKINSELWMSYLQGVLDSDENAKMAVVKTGTVESFSLEKYILKKRVCGMTLDQIMKIIKKWCDNNPEETDRNFASIISYTLDTLPERNCE